MCIPCESGKFSNFPRGGTKCENTASPTSSPTSPTNIGPSSPKRRAPQDPGQVFMTDWLHGGLYGGVPGAFSQFDQDMDGSLDGSELESASRKFIELHGRRVSFQGYAQSSGWGLLLKKWDKDWSGSLSREEIADEIVANRRQYNANGCAPFGPCACPSACTGYCDCYPHMAAEDGGPGNYCYSGGYKSCGPCNGCAGGGGSPPPPPPPPPTPVPTPATAAPTTAPTAAPTSTPTVFPQHCIVFFDWQTVSTAVL